MRNSEIIIYDIVANLNVDLEKAIDMYTNKEIDTYKGWKKRGFQVKKGCHKAFSSIIWLPKDNLEEPIPKDKKVEKLVQPNFRKVKANYFLIKDVEKIQ